MVERYSIGVDIGGTFTDLVMFDEVTGRLYNENVLTTPKDPSVGVLEGIERILAGRLWIWTGYRSWRVLFFLRAFGQAEGEATLLKADEKTCRHAIHRQNRKGLII